MKKVLVIPGALHIGGAERVAANISRYAPTEEFVFHYVIFEGYENVYGPEIEALGGKVITLPSPRKGYLCYCKELYKLIKCNHYAIVHSHTQFNSGINLAVAKLLNVPIRIAHSHTTKTEHRVSVAQKIYEQAMRCLLRYSATHLVACGVEAGNWMFGTKCFQKKGIVLKNGIDAVANSFSEENRTKIRRLYGISSESFVIGHTGTLLPIKNQEFLIRLLPGLLEHNPLSVLLLLGAGSPEELSRLKSITEECAVTDSVIFGGPVLNVHEALSAMDVFAFPSLREGTPLSLLEAQANGLPCAVSDRVPSDAFLTDLICTLPLDNQTAWINALCRTKRKDPKRYAFQIAETGYDVHQAYMPVYQIYHSIATVSLSFDDGRGDNITIFDNLLLPKHIPATLNITTGYVDRTCPEEDLPTKKPAMLVEDVQRLAKDPLVEIAIHGNNHKNTESDILEGRRKLLAWMNLNDNTRLGFASPGSGLSLEYFRSSKGTILRNSVIYCRTSLRISTLHPLRLLSRKGGRIIHLPLLYRFAYHDTVMTEADGQIIYSVPVMKDTTVSQIMSVIKSAIKRRGALVLMFHSIEQSLVDSDNWSWSKAKMQFLCEELCQLEENGRITVCTTRELFKRLQERV